MSKTKYEIENGIIMQGGMVNLIQQVDFDTAEVKDFPYHIYFICTRPKIKIPVNGINLNKDEYTITFEKQFHDHIEIEKLTYQNDKKYKTFKVNNSGSRFSMFTEEGECANGKTSLIYPLLLAKDHNKYDPISDLKVVYIGQAFGEDGNRVAADRLISHSTLQKVYSVVSDENPTDDVWLLMFEFKPYNISLMGSGFENSEVGIESSIENFLKVQSTPIPLDQQVTATEAALIRYFEPQYNKEYKTTFPKQSHSSYEICYKLDLNTVGFEFDTNCILTRLYSDSVEPDFMHIGKFPLHNQKQRKAMFNIFHLDQI